jgi:hypothetical protein
MMLRFYHYILTEKQIYLYIYQDRTVHQSVHGSIIFFVFVFVRFVLLVLSYNIETKLGVEI